MNPARRTLAKLVKDIGYFLGGLADCFFVYFMWPLDWGRQWRLWVISLVFGTIIVFAIVAGLVGWIALAIDPEVLGPDVKSSPGRSRHPKLP